MPRGTKHETTGPNLDLEARKREFGAAVRRTRQGLGITQGQLAADWAYSRSVITNLENGRFDTPVYLRASSAFEQLPVIAEIEEKRVGRELPRDVARDAVAEFDEMLVDRARDRKALMGTWHALWETTVEGNAVFNSEILTLAPMLSRKRVMITNLRASAENPIGGYAWQAECRFLDGDMLLGVYASTEAENVSKGALQMRVHPHGRIMEGQWIGEGYGGAFSYGHAVFARDRAQLVFRMEALLGRAIRFEFVDEVSG